MVSARKNLGLDLLRAELKKFVPKKDDGSKKKKKPDTKVAET